MQPWWVPARVPLCQKTTLGGIWSCTHHIYLVTLRRKYTRARENDYSAYNTAKGEGLGSPEVEFTGLTQALGQL